MALLLPSVIKERPRASPVMRDRLVDAFTSTNRSVLVVCEGAGLICPEDCPGRLEGFWLCASRRPAPAASIHPLNKMTAIPLIQWSNRTGFAPWNKLVLGKLISSPQRRTVTGA